MTEIAFHFNVSDKLAYSCRLIRKAYASGVKVLVTAETPDLVMLDELLWTFSAAEFIPHALLNRENSLAVAQTPVLLTQAPDACPHHQVLVNLSQGLPATFERFERLIEVVSSEKEDRLAARARWKHYADRGYVLERHDRSAAQGAA